MEQKQPTGELLRIYLDQKKALENEKTMHLPIVTLPDKTGPRPQMDRSVPARRLTFLQRYPRLNSLRLAIIKFAQKDGWLL